MNQQFSNSAGKLLHRRRLWGSMLYHLTPSVGFPSGIIRYYWNDTENISMAPVQG